MQCRRNFDDAYNPFLPRSQKEDRRRRRKLGRRQGTTPRRMCPTAQTYEDVPGLSEYGASKPWAGSPMAALQRAVIIMQKLNLCGIPRDIINLRALQDIYSKLIDIAGVSDSDDGEIEVSLS
jgi:hypothetical protein